MSVPNSAGHILAATAAAVPPAASSRDHRSVVGIAYGAERAIVTSNAERQLVHVRLAEEQRAGCEE